MDDIDFYLLITVLGGIEFSPLWLPLALLLRWRKAIRARFRFFILIFLALVTALLGLEILFEIAARDGAMWFERYHQFCAGMPRAACRAFDFVHAYRIYLAMACYSAFALGLIAVLWVRKPGWAGFIPRATLEP